MHIKLLYTLMVVDFGPDLKGTGQNKKSLWKCLPTDTPKKSFGSGVNSLDSGTCLGDHPKVLGKSGRRWQVVASDR